VKSFAVCDAYCYFAGQALLRVAQNIEYQRITLQCLIDTLISRKKANFIGRPALIQCNMIFFKIWQWLVFMATLYAVLMKLRLL